MAAGDGAGDEGGLGVLRVVPGGDGLVQVGEGLIGGRVVEPVGEGVDNEAARVRRACRRRPHLPV